MDERPKITVNVVVSNPTHEPVSETVKRLMRSMRRRSGGDGGASLPGGH